MNKGKAIYRLPHSTRCTSIEGEVENISILSEDINTEGYIIAPFSPTADEPILLIHNERISVYDSAEAIPSTEDIQPQGFQKYNTASASREEYGIRFASYHGNICQGRIQKVVLAIKDSLQTDEHFSPLQLFRKACDTYPRAMVAMFSTPQSGTWIVATPELLLERSGNNCHTVALAGTQRWHPDTIEWDQKNRDEQHIVEQYIAHSLRQFAEEIDIEGPYTSRAAHLVHLKSDIRCILKQDFNDLQLINRLHPTPAVCGLPLRETFCLINSEDQRSYYTGFSGPIGIDHSAHVYVTLRCMKINSSQSFTLYAGGGIMSESIEEKEWEEVHSKLETMQNLLKTNK